MTLLNIEILPLFTGESIPTCVYTFPHSETQPNHSRVYFRKLDRGGGGGGANRTYEKSWGEHENTSGSI